MSDQSAAHGWMDLADLMNRMGFHAMTRNKLHSKQPRSRLGIRRTG